ncbi:leucine-rich repeat domain-containing protein [Chloropicon primus]|uniref:Leucine-rich repeat domain-containing protein n=1 Tax=Chloropicon primus TaxID=1764295 RepID=A0A5B8MIS0_9CHLO|nr:leucine-rich repeat domain-containing protein [Chloropicon primus]UPQ98777.1 leucine-rich repeat domain-containing protein [Chloropicon primus]|eukprot:QDZ19565.1 leucine-rich repeat domain-containing protein [Chloropicon primus]
MNGRGEMMTLEEDVPLTKRAILEEARTFDLEIVTKLACTNRRITRIACLESCVNITELNLSGNFLRGIQGLENLVKLRKLILTSNRIESLKNIEQIPSLQHLLIQDNKISSPEDFEHLKCLPNLQSVYFQNHGGDLPNPVCKVRHYKIKVLDLLPDLRNLDGERKPSKNLFNVDVTLLEPEGGVGGLEDAEGREYCFAPLEENIDTDELVRPAKALLAEMHTLNISAKDEISKAKKNLL